MVLILQIRGIDKSQVMTVNSGLNSDSSSKEGCSSPAPLRWPIRKEQLMSKCGDVSKDEENIVRISDCGGMVRWERNHDKHWLENCCKPLG
ncbi:hypothetical protein L1887_39410 [Cichorium endivia]|nr:hypothetical protein L1887_39410 [Cichorium endivia]